MWRQRTPTCDLVGLSALPSICVATQRLPSLLDSCPTILQRCEEETILNICRYSVFVGSFVMRLNAVLSVSCWCRIPLRHREIQKCCPFRTPLAHPTFNHSTRFGAFPVGRGSVSAFRFEFRRSLLFLFAFEVAYCPPQHSCAHRPMPLSQCWRVSGRFMRECIQSVCASGSFLPFVAIYTVCCF